MRVVVTAGGSGGHITPILAVAHELKKQFPDTEIVYIGQRGDRLSDIPAGDPNIDAVYTVWAGKFRRYADEDWHQWLNVRTQALNIRDVFRVVVGLWQSFLLLRKLRPDIIFTRGGFVSVPVALGGYLNGIPYITHDSDSVPSLANRLIARWAHTHAVALPPEVYPYALDKTVFVGVPVSRHYQPVTATLRRRYREVLGIRAGRMVFVTGGGNGARQLNIALVQNARYLLGTYPDLEIVHVAGRALEDETNAAYDALRLGKARSRVTVYGFLENMYQYSGAADVVVARGGANTLAEFALQQTACIIIPASQLVGGHQVKNTQFLAKKGAVIQLSEDQTEQPERLGRTIGELLNNDRKRDKLAQTLAMYAHPHAAAELASLLVDIVNRRGHVRTEK